MMYWVQYLLAKLLFFRLLFLLIVPVTDRYKVQIYTELRIQNFDLQCAVWSDQVQIDDPVIILDW